MRLTAAGKSFLEEARRLLSELERVVERTRLIAQGRSGLLPTLPACAVSSAQSTYNETLGNRHSLNGLRSRHCKSIQSLSRRGRGFASSYFSTDHLRRSLNITVRGLEPVINFSAVFSVGWRAKGNANLCFLRNQRQYLFSRGATFDLSPAFSTPGRSHSSLTVAAATVDAGWRNQPSPPRL